MERRNYYRLQDILTIDYQPLSLEEYQKEKKLFYDQPSGLRNLKNKYANFIPNDLHVIENLGDEDNELIRSLIKLVININEKVDRILSHLEKKEDLNLYQKPGQKVTLSADGIGFWLSEPLPSDTYLKLKLLLPHPPHLLIIILGQITRVTDKMEEGKKGFEVGVRFLDIQEDDREAMIRYIFMRQREILRNKGNLS